MSRQLLSRSADLQRLLGEGYEIAFRSNMLLIGVPYVNKQREVARGYLVSSLEPDGDHTAQPSDHTVFFVGETQAADDHPCDREGQPLLQLMNNPNGPIQVATDVIASCQFSQKPQPDGKYLDYYDKMTTYAAMLLAEVTALDPSVRAQTFQPLATEEGESVHRYFDSATSLARIGAVSDKTKGQKVAIIGLGGTGSYILDALSKTHVAEIHLYDGDLLLTHNAFRAPGAVPLSELEQKPSKAEHHQRTYDRVHRYVTAHPVHIDDQNVEEVRGMDFVFVSIDGGPAKKLIFEKLQEFAIPFVDTGMGIDQSGDSLGGIVRTTGIIPSVAAQEWIADNVSFAGPDEDDYDQNIQIVELNMLNAALAVIAWKKHIGFYRDYNHETESHYTIDGSLMTRVGGDED